MSISGLRHSYTYRNQDLASNETIFAAVTMLSSAMSSLPVSIRQEYRKLEPEDHRIAELLAFGPNPNMTTAEFIRCMETLRNIKGAAYALKEFDENWQVSALWIMKSELVTPYIDPETRELYYKVRDDVNNEVVMLHSSLVVAVGHISADGINPINPIDVLQSSLSYDREVKQFSVDQMQNGLRAKYAITFPVDLSEDQLKEYDEKLRAFKKSGVLYLDGRKDIKPLTGGEIIDPKVFEVENITIARVARVFNIPLDKFLPDKASYSSAEQSDLNYMRDTILPNVRLYEQELSKKLLSEEERGRGLEIKFSLNGFARADMDTRGNFYQKGIRSGWFCPDDVRGLEDSPPLPDNMGKEFFISKDLVPIRVLLDSFKAGAGNQGGAAAPAASPGGEQISRVSLNGAQISSILQVVQAVTGGQMEYNAAVTLLTSAFPFDRATAVEILGDPNKLAQRTGGEEN